MVLVEEGWDVKKIQVPTRQRQWKQRRVGRKTKVEMDRKETSSISHSTPTTKPPRWPSGKASASRAEDPEFESRLRRDFFGVVSHQ